jgi:hypothetical protein
VIIKAHGHAKVVRVLNAQILNFVARLRDRSAEASQNHRRNPEYPEIPQLPKRIHIYSSGKSCGAEMTGTARCQRILQSNE